MSEDPELLAFEEAAEVDAPVPDNGTADEDPLAEDDLLGLGLHRLHPQGPEHLYKQAQLFVLDSVWKAEREGPPDLEQGLQVARRLRAFVDERETAMVGLALDRGQDFSISAHTVNVAIVSLRLARELGWPEKKRCQVGLAALLHELGVAKLPSGLLYKTGNPTKDEMDALRGRPRTAARILQGAQGSAEELASWVSQVLERRDGSGFPSGTSGDRIAPEAQLLAVADAFEAGVHRRPQRPPRTGHQMIAELIADSPRFYWRQTVSALLAAFTLYPIGECVELNTGEMGVVIDIRREHPSRPLIEVQASASGVRPRDPKRIDLATSPALSVKRALNRFSSS